MLLTDYWNLTYFLESNIFVNLEPVWAYFDLLVGCLALALAEDINLASVTTHQYTNAQESHYTNTSQTAGESHHEIVCDQRYLHGNHRGVVLVPHTLRCSFL